jgi:hypothetical protein
MTFSPHDSMLEGEMACHSTFSPFLKSRLVHEERGRTVLSELQPRASSQFLRARASYWARPELRTRLRATTRCRWMPPPPSRWESPSTRSPPWTSKALR